MGAGPGHGPVLHPCWPVRAPHGAPPFEGGVRTERDCVCVPELHWDEQGDHADHADKTQSTGGPAGGHGSVLHGAEDDVGPQGVPPKAAGVKI